MRHEAGTGAGAPTAEDTLRAGEDLVVVRSGGWRMLLPMRHVERVLQAAMPAARPSASPASPVVAVGEELLPVVFAGALAGEAEVGLEAAQQMILLASGGARALLWVDAVEDVVPHAPAAPPHGARGDGLVLGWSCPERPLAVLDVPRVVALAT